MGAFRDPITIDNTGAVGSATNPTTGTGLALERDNQRAIMELPGAQAPESLSILDGSISPTRAAVIVDTEGGAPADDLTVIATTLSDGGYLHDGMELRLQARDTSRVVTVRNSASVNGILTTDGGDLPLSTEWWLILRLENGTWRQVSVSEPVDVASKSAAGVVRVGDGIEVEQGVISVPPTPLATAATPGLMQPDNVTCAVNEAGVLSGISMFFNTRLVLTTSGIFTVPVSTWYKIVIVGAGGAGGSTYAGGSAGGHSSFGDLLTARGGSGGGGCAYCGGGGGYAGDVVTGIVFLEAETKISFIVGAGGFPQSGGSATAPIQATGTNIGYYASNVGGTGANNGTAIFYYNDGKDLCGGNGGTGGRNGSGYGGGGGGAAGYVAIPYAGQGLYRPVGGYGCDSGTAGAAYTGTNYAYLAGGNGGDGAIILEFYDPNKPTA